MKTARSSLVVIVLLLFSSACAQAQSEQEMYELGSALTKVSKAVESTVHFKKQGIGLEDEALLELATAHDPDLLRPFVEYRLRARQERGHAAVLVCTWDGSEALLEDAGCTARMEAHHWKVRPALPCAFTLDLNTVCPGP